MDKTVAKAVRLIEALARSAEPRGISELARDLDLTKSNVHRLVETLRQLGYVNRGDNGTYFLSLEIWRLGLQVMSRVDVREASLPYLEALTASTGETARLSVFVNDQGVCVQQVQSSNPVGVITRVGGTLLSYCSATGKALLAYQDDEVIERIAATLEKFTPHTVATPAELREELELIRRNGFAINRGEWRENVRGVGAPVWSGDGRVIAAIGISGPGTRLPVKKLKQLSVDVREAGLRLSRELGYMDAPDS